ncbi:cyclic nucleotide-binding domain-containing protein [Streptosporangiaceae bacterium NEAU-GS5]|nr:cyclic nucleotide-binding domain-containing protein [Streptosporangiaceae bacterium NEAU-GS5]
MAAVDDRAGRLGRLGIFSDLTDPEIRTLADELPGRIFPAGVHVIRRGHPGDGLYIILEGEAGVVIDDEERALLTTGSFFGEVSVLLAEFPTADVVTRTTMCCLVIPPEEVEAFLLAHPRVMFRMLQTEARRLRSAVPERN